MEANIESVPVSKAMLWTGRIISTLAMLFMLMDGVMKLLKPKFVVDGTIQLGYPESCIVPLGVVLTASTILYAIPRTSILGAILLTGYLGGAVATNVRVSAAPAMIAFPVLVGVLVWLGLFLRDGRLRSLVPIRR